MTTDTNPSIKQARHPAESYLEPVVRNAFRLLGLRASASQAEVYEAAAAVRRRLKLGVAFTTAQDAPWLGPLERTEADVRDALGRLADPARRASERLFWFHEDAPHEQPTAAPAPPLDAQGDQPIDMQGDRASEPSAPSGDAQPSPARQHDAALAAFAAALRFDAGVADAGRWSRALELWRELIEADGFWSLLVAADLKGDFEQLATPGEVRSLRAGAMRSVTTPLAALAKDGLAREDYQLTRRALGVLAVLDGSAAGARLFDEYENEILAPLEDAFEESRRKMLEEYGRERWRMTSDFRFRPVAAAQGALKEFDERLKPALSKFLSLAGVERLPVRRAFESAAVALFELSKGYRAGGQEEGAAEVARSAWRLAPPDSAAAFEIEEQLNESGRPDWVTARTAGEYLRDVRAELRPRPELFRFRAEPEKSPPAKAAWASWRTASVRVVPPPRNPLEAFGRLLGLGVIMFLCGLFGARYGPGRRHSYGPPYLPPPSYNFNYNVRLPLPEFKAQPLDLEQLNLDLRTDAARARTRRANRRRTKRTTLSAPPDNTAQVNQ